MILNFINYIWIGIGSGCSDLNAQAIGVPFPFSIANQITIAMNQKEIWKDIDGTNGKYQVSNHARVRSHIGIRKYSDGRIFNYSEKIIAQCLGDNGYLSVGISVNDKRKTKRVHRLKAIAFIPNPNNHPCINHRDGVKTNNNKHADGNENLEWCSYSKNNNHAYIAGLKIGKSGLEGKFGDDNPNSIKVNAYNLDNTLYGSYDSMNEASLFTGARQGNISKVCSGKIHTTGGFKFKIITKS